MYRDKYNIVGHGSQSPTRDHQQLVMHVQIDLKALLSQPNPHIDLGIQEFEASTRNFVKAVSNYKNRSVGTINERRTNHAGEKKRLNEKIKLIEEETKACKIREIELVDGTSVAVVFTCSVMPRTGEGGCRKERRRESCIGPEAANDTDTRQMFCH